MGAPAEHIPTTSLLNEQRSLWQRGERRPVEHYVERQPALRENTEVLLDLIYAEVVLRREAGEMPSVAEYVARFPALAEPIRMQFEVDEAIVGGTTQLPTHGRVGDFVHATPPAPPGYKIVEQIGRGGMGVVYKARHTLLNRLVALKMIRSGELADPAERQRFDAEARAVARLSHPNIVQIYEVGEVNGQPFLALEYIAGETLAEALRGQPLPPRQAAELGIVLAGALQHAHDAGVVHRDLKPANILLADPRGQDSSSRNQSTALGIEPTLLADIGNLKPKVTDFGLAKEMGSAGLTRTGDFLGTPNYAAPEQAAGRPDVGPAADVFALGAILYHTVTGRPPFAGSTPLEILDQVRFTDPVPPSRLRTNLPRDLGTIILRCLHKESPRRYHSAQALADDLGRFLAGNPIQARPVGWFERAVKWSRRRPAVAGLLAFVVLFAAAALVAVTTLWRREVAARDAEHQQREQAIARSAELLIANARYAWMTDDTVVARRALDECPLPYRNADWAYLNKALGAARLQIAVADDTVLAVAFDADNRRLAGATFTGDVYIWDAQTGRELLRVKAYKHGIDRVFNLAFLSDDRLALALRTVQFEKKKSTGLTEFKVLNARTGAVVGGWSRPEDQFFVALSRDGRRALGVDSGHRSALLLDTESGTELQRFTSPTQQALVATMSANGQVVVTRTEGSNLSFWRADDGRLIRQQKLPNTVAVATGLLATDAEGRRIYAGLQRSDRPAEIVVLDHERELFRLGTSFSFLSALALSPDGRLFTGFGREKSAITVWDAHTGAERIVLRGYAAALRYLTFSHDSRELAVSYHDGRVVIWKIEP